MKLIYIHGASATSESFNFIRSKIGGDDLAVDYDSGDGFRNNLASIQEQLSQFKDIFFIAHSLGGVYSLHLADLMPDQVLGAVTLSTPYGGAEVADVAKYFLPYSRLMKDIGPNSWVMQQVNKIKLQHPWCNIVSTRGQSPWIVSPNDGVVTISSQRSREDMELIEVDYNHYEVVLSNQIVNLIKERIDFHK
jgi:hypothetical protein